MKKVQFRKRPEKPIMWCFATGLFLLFLSILFLEFSSVKKDDAWNPLSLKRDGSPQNYYNIGKVPQRAELLGSVSFGSLVGNSKTEIILAEVPADAEHRSVLPDPKPCPEGKIRNPLTNRCIKNYDERHKKKPKKPQESGKTTEPKDPQKKPKQPKQPKQPKPTKPNQPKPTENIVNKPCKPGYVRNQETHRCNKIATPKPNTPKQCKPGYYLNQATHRCNKENSHENQPKICKTGYYLNPQTHRCKKISPAGNAKKPCEVGKTINPKSGRCVKIPVPKTPKTCGEGKELNPATNRCKKIDSKDEKTPAPCKEGYERNPETHRCRKQKANTGATDKLEVPKTGDPEKTPKQFNGSTAIIGSSVAGIGLLLFQFRVELIEFVKKIFIKK